MENDDDMRRIMEPLLTNFLKVVRVKAVATDLFVPRDHQTKELFQNMMTVLSAKRSLIYKRWENFCAISCSNALSTHEMYLKYIMYACDIELRFSDNIFERILSVFALVINFNIETLINSGVYFCELSVDIFLVFYKRTLRESFYRQGGFEQFSEYLRRHEYLPWENYMLNNLDVSNLHVTKRELFLRNLHYKTEKEIENVPFHPNFIKHSDVIESTKCESLAKEVLSTTKIKLPMLINSTELEVRLHIAWQEKAAVYAEISKRQTTSTSEGQTTSAASDSETMVTGSKHETTGTGSKRETTAESLKCKTTSASSKRKTASASSKRKTASASSKRKTTAASSKRETTTASSNRETADTVSIRKTSEAALETMETVLQRFANLESDSQTNNTVERKKHLDWCENIVQTVVKYNNSKYSDPANANNQIQKKADKFLKQLKDMIKSLIDALEDYNEE